MKKKKYPNEYFKIKKTISHKPLFFGCSEIKTSKRPHPKGWNLISDIKENIRNKAKIIFIGTFFKGRKPCHFLPNGSSRWRLITGFNVKKDLIGNIKKKIIEIDPSIVETKKHSIKLLEEQDYLVLLDPINETLETITNKICTNYWYVTKKEIIKLIKI